MADEVHHYDIGEWIVHSRYGVGEIKSIEQIPLYGDVQNKEKCFKVQTNQSIFWFPVEQSKNPRIRPLASRKRIKEALRVLKEPPQDVQAHHNVLKGRINEVKNNGSLTDKISLIRDLLARQTVKKLNLFEEQALKTLQLQLVREWSITTGTYIAVAQVELDAAFRDARSTIS